MPKSPTSSTKSASQASPVNRSWLAAQGKLPLCFMGLGMVWLLVASVLMLLQSRVLLEGHTSPHVISIAHAWLLGFFVTVATGAIYQIVPVALNTKLWNEPLGWAHLWLQMLGVPGMVVAFWFYRLDVVGAFGSAVAVGVLLFTVNTWITVKRSPRSDVVAWSIVLASGWLAFGVLAGLFVVANRVWGLVSIDPIALLRFHAHLGLIGFFVTLLQGVGFQLVPMFTLGQVEDWRAAKLGIWCSQIGLLILLSGFLWQVGWLEIAGSAAISLGLIASGFGVKQALATRKKMRFDPGVGVFLRGGIVLIIASMVGVALAVLGATHGMATGGFGPMIYAILGIFGGLLPCVAGMMCKVVPFLTWMRAYGPLVGRMRTPAAHSLTRPKLEQWGLGLQQISAIPMLIGLWNMSELWVSIGAGLLLTGVVIFLADMLGVLKHLWKKSEMAPLVFATKTQKTT